jgi:hypothetical protein
MNIPVPEVFVKYDKWIVNADENSDFVWKLKPGAPKEAKILFEKFKKQMLDAKKKGMLL